MNSPDLTENPATDAPQVPSPPAAQIECDDSIAAADYANFCRLSGTPEEVLIDFGVNPQATTPSSVAVTQRVVTGWHTAKRLMQVLQITVERHEEAFGVLETDVQKRVRRT